MGRFECVITRCTNTPPLGTQPLAQGWAYVPNGRHPIGAGWYCPDHAGVLSPEYQPTPPPPPGPDDMEYVNGVPVQPDGIHWDSRDLPTTAAALARVGAYIEACGDGLYDVEGGAPLYGRDLEQLCRAAAQAEHM